MPLSPWYWAECLALSRSQSLEYGIVSSWIETSSGFVWFCFFFFLFFLQPHQPPLQTDSPSQSARNGNEKAPDQFISTCLQKLCCAVGAGLSCSWVHSSHANGCCTDSPSIHASRGMAIGSALILFYPVGCVTPCGELGMCAQPLPTPCSAKPMGWESHGCSVLYGSHCQPRDVPMPGR